MKILGFYITREDYKRIAKVTHDVFIKEHQRHSNALTALTVAEHERDEAFMKIKELEDEVSDKRNMLGKLILSYDELCASCDKLIDENTEYSAQIDELKKQLDK